MATKSIYKEVRLSLEDHLSGEFYHFYKDFTYFDQLPNVLSSIQNIIVQEFRAMNSLLPSGNYSRHFWASNSRRLILGINALMELKSIFEIENIPIKINENILTVCKKCRDFLQSSGGSEIPKGTDKLPVFSDDPIFETTNTIEQPVIRFSKAELKMVGSGSYANVFTFKDPFYNKRFAVKRAKSDLTDKELERFKIEYDYLKRFKSPYIVEVYKFDDTNNEYILEYLDTTVVSYYKKYNDKLCIKKRKSFIYQFLRGLREIHNKGLLHRDLSPNNLMLKMYDDVEVVKITDFGLVKENISELTSLDSDIKGSFNDPRLKVDGFSNYSFEHEIYAITLMCIFLLTGKDKNFYSIKNPEIIKILEKGTNSNITLRYESIDELEKDIIKIKKI